MYAKLTRLRLTVAAALVVGGVAAPLAYATIVGPNAPTTGATPAAPLAAATSAVALTGASTGDNPYQLYYDMANLTGNTCHTLNLPAGQDFVLESATVSDVFGPADVRIYAWAMLPGTVGRPVNGFQIPVTGSIPSGHAQFTLLVRPDLPGNAAIGDIWAMGVCIGSGAYFGSGGSLILTGQKVTSPTAATVSDFSARSRPSGTTLRWTTASETQILGFNVWRYRGAKGVKVNRTLVRAKRSGKPAGASYRYVDQVRAKRGLTYRLQLVDLKGKRTWYAAFAIAS